MVFRYSSCKTITDIFKNIASLRQNRYHYVSNNQNPLKSIKAELNLLLKISTAEN